MSWPSVKTRHHFVWNRTSKCMEFDKILIHRRVDAFALFLKNHLQETEQPLVAVFEPIPSVSPSSVCVRASFKLSAATYSNHLILKKMTRKFRDKVLSISPEFRVVSSDEDVVDESEFAEIAPKWYEKIMYKKPSQIIDVEEIPRDSACPGAVPFFSIKETPQTIRLKTEGTIPTWLSGRYFQNGPSVRHRGKALQIKHWFDGLSQVHRFDFDNGIVTYQSRVMATVERDVISTTARFNYPSFGQPTDMTKLGQLIAFCRSLTAPVVPSNNQASLAEIKMKSESGEPRSLHVIKTDQSQLLQFDPDNLEPIKVINYGDLGQGLQGIVSVAHEEYDPETKEYFNFVIMPGRFLELRVLKISEEDTEAKLFATIWLDQMPACHSFSSTKKYLIIPAPPLVYKAMGLKILWSRNVMDAYKRIPGQGTRFYVIDRSTGKLVATYVDPDGGILFHTLNAFDDGDDIVIDTIRTKTNTFAYFMLNTLRTEQGLKDYKVDGKLVRYRLPKVSRVAAEWAHRFKPEKVPEGNFPHVEWDYLSEQALDVPRFNELYRHNPSYRYVYGSAKIDEDGAQLIDSIIKLDIQDGTKIIWTPGNGQTPAEPVFVPRPGATEEDDGVVFVVVTDGVQKSSALVILDAKSMTVLGRALAPNLMSFPFHGYFLPRE